MLKVAGFVIAITAAAAMPMKAQADAGGDILAGALAGVVVGAVIAGGIAQHEALRQHIIQERRPSYRYDDEVVVGRELRHGAYESYDVPERYAAPNHRYTIINDRPVVYHHPTRRIIHVYE